MPELDTDVGAPYSPGALRLADAQTGNGATTNTIDRGGRSGPALLQIVTVVGATPTATFLVEGSADGTSWFPVPWADPATPTVVSVASFAITTATTTRRYLLGGYPWRHLRVTVSANTNVTFTVDVYVF